MATKSMNPKTTNRKPLLPFNKNKASTTPMVTKFENAPIVNLGAKNKAPFDQSISPKNWAKATPAQANRLHVLTKHPGRAKANGTNKGPRPGK